MTTNKNVLQVLKGYLELSSTEKLEFQRELNSLNIFGVVTNDYNNNVKKIEVQIQLKSHLGPTNDNVCKFCGK